MRSDDTHQIRRFTMNGSCRAAEPGVNPLNAPCACSDASSTSGSSTWARPGGSAIARITRSVSDSSTTRISVAVSSAVIGSRRRCTVNRTPMTITGTPADPPPSRLEARTPTVIVNAGRRRPWIAASTTTAVVIRWSTAANTLIRRGRPLSVFQRMNGSLAVRFDPWRPISRW